MLLGPVDQAPSTDDPDAGLVEAATRIAFVVATTGVAAIVVIGLLGALLLAVVDGVARAWRRHRDATAPPGALVGDEGQSTSSSST